MKGNNMKILGLSFSPRKNKTTWQSMEACMAAAAEVSGDVKTQLIDMGEKEILPCIACSGCREGVTCTRHDDLYEMLDVIGDPEVKGMIIGTPVYFAGMSAQAKAFIDRCILFRRNGWMFRDRVGGVLTVGAARNGGQEIVQQSLHAAMLCHDMIVVGDGEKTSHFGAALVSEGKREIEHDAFGLKTARNLGRRVAEVALKYHG